MAKIAPRPVCPEEVTNEVLLPARGETVYWLALADEDVELLSDGLCPERIATQAHVMLRWKRDHYKKEAQDAVLERTGRIVGSGR
jgi:hypothetical protein